MKRLIFSILFLFLISVLPLFAEKETPPEGGRPKDFNIPEKKSKSLANGLEAVLVSYGQAPKVTVTAIVKTGNLHEGPQEVWLADLTADMMREGAAGMNFQAIANKVAAMGGELTVSVSRTEAVVGTTVLSEFAGQAIQLVADVLTRPTFPESELARLKNDLKRQLNVQKSVPQNQASEKFSALLYPDQPYGRMFPTEQILDSFDIAKVKAFYDSNFGARRTKVYVVGKFAHEPAVNAIEEAFGKWREGPAVNYPVAKPSFAKQNGTIEREGAPQTTILLGLPVIAPSDPDYIALRVANALLAGSFGSRITSNIRENKGYTYSPSGVLQAGLGTAVWYELADVTSEHTAAALKEIHKEIERLQNEPPSVQELLGIQNYVAGVFVLQNSSPSGIINQLHFQDLHGLPADYLTTYVKKVYAVTPEKVQQLVKSHIKADQMTLVMVGDKKYL
ncbi:insulinase family protein [bacterium]|nr:insulinase family protein [bacterium]MCI0605015.1 insulinase family protein [bacterium]